MPIATAQVSVDTTSGGTLLAAERAGRASITIINHGNTPVYVGLPGLTTSTGALLNGAAGASLTLGTQAAIYGIVGTGSQTVSVIEAY
jgi:hypothetical protein